MQTIGKTTDGRLLIGATTDEIAQMRSACLMMAATLGTVDTDTQPKVNVKIASGLVFTGDSNKGIQLSATPGTWVAPTAVALNTTNYDIVRGDAIDIRCTEAGVNGDAECLSLFCTFVLE
jgi:hypothetical protein